MKKFDDNDLINDDANLKFKSNVNINLLKKLAKFMIINIITINQF